MAATPARAGRAHPAEHGRVVAGPDGRCCIVAGPAGALVLLARRGTLGGTDAREGTAPSQVETVLPIGERRSLLIVSVEGRRLLLGASPVNVSLVDGTRPDAGLRRRARQRATQTHARSPADEAARARVALVAALRRCSRSHACSAAQPSQLDLTVDGVGKVSAPLQIVLVLTLLTFLPAILVTMTSFTRIVIVFHFLRQALGTQEMPPNQVLIGLALFLTMFVMAPVGERIHADARAAGDGGPDVGGARRSSARRRRCATFMLQADARARPGAVRRAREACRAPRRRTTCRCGSSFRPTPSRS